jgi:hypothetical protein
MAAKLLDLDSVESLRRYPYFTHLSVSEGKQDIPIEEVRRIIKLMGLKVPGSNLIRRLVLIEDADYLSLPAQNAILKILEEPSEDSVFILTAASTNSVLPTIASRVQHIDVLPVGLATAKSYLKDQSLPIERSWELSKGRPGLLIALTKDDEDHPLKNAVQTAKKFLAQTKYERLLTITGISQNKEQLGQFLEALERTLSALHRRALEAGRSSQAQKLLQSRKAAKSAAQALADNANPKLIAIDLALSLRI